VKTRGNRLDADAGLAPVSSLGVVPVRSQSVSLLNDIDGFYGSSFVAKRR